MDIWDKQAKIRNYCDSMARCSGCKLWQRKANVPGFTAVGCTHEEVVEEHYEIIFANEESNPYWERINAIAERQRAKVMSKYGVGLESNPAAILERIEHLQEELIDGLMYCEWIKDHLTELEG